MSSIIVNGMHCQHCTAAVTKAMQAVPEAGGRDQFFFTS